MVNTRLPESGDRVTPAQRGRGNKAQDKMLDSYMKENNLQDKDWRPKMYKKLEGK